MYQSRLVAKAALENGAGILVRFWSHVGHDVADEDCWTWSGPVDGNGAPLLRFPGGSVSAARLAWYIVLREFPLAGQASRRCGNPLCVRPTHLRWRVSYRARAWMSSMHDGYVPHAATPTVELEREAVLHAVGRPVPHVTPA